MHGKPRTNKQARRIQIITQELGCLACHLEGCEYEPACYHHCDDKKQHHDRGYGLCPWHHDPQRGDPDDAWFNSYGPSKALHGKQFTDKYGTEQELLDLQNKRIEEWEKSNVNSKRYVG